MRPLGFSDTLVVSAGTFGGLVSGNPYLSAEDFTGFYGISWGSMWFHEVPCGSIRFHEIP